MARRNEDFDEFCDPDNPKELSINDVMEAAEAIKPYIIKTKCFPSHRQREFSMNVYYKPETFQRTGSFKERGAVNVLLKLTADKKKIGVVIASLGNEALSLCYHASNMNIPVVVVMPTTVHLSKQQKCHSYGAKVLLQGSNLMEAQKYARAIARDKGLTYINGRDHPHILAGYGTIALEILENIPQVDAILVPTGSGGLLASISTVIKNLKPKCLVYGVQPENLSSFFQSLQKGSIVSNPMYESIADSIAVPNVGVNAFSNALSTVDKMLLVNEEWISRAMMHLVDKERLIVEGAAACTLAAIMGSLVPELKLQNVVCILSGGNVDSMVVARCLDRGMAAEGRLMKFSIAIKDVAEEKHQLLSLLAKGGYNIIREFQDRTWTNDDIYRVEIALTCETKSLEHALELKRIIDKAYPCTAVFETEPFNDKRTCPCYIRKFM